MLTLDETYTLVAELLDYIDWLEINGGRSLQDGGLKRPLIKAAKFLEQINHSTEEVK